MDVTDRPKFDKQAAIDQAKHEDSDGYFGFLTGAEWQYAQLAPALAMCQGVLREEAAECERLRKEIAGLRGELHIERGLSGASVHAWGVAHKDRDAWAAQARALAEALEFYRNENNWLKKPSEVCSWVIADTGTRARKALAAFEAFRKERGE